MHTKNQLPRLPGSALKVPGGGVGSYPLSSQAPTQVEVELGCDNSHIAINPYDYIALWPYLVHIAIWLHNIEGCLYGCSLKVNHFIVLNESKIY
jgi:hypothetical protein